jgi:dCTP deaminase
MVLGHFALKKRVYELFPRDTPRKIGAASIDVSVGTGIILENGTTIDISDYSEQYPWLMEPGAFLLVAMKEYTVLPRGLSSLFLLKSTLARMGMSHAFAGWIDPGWEGILTMELKNYNQERPLPLWPGMPIGQLIYLVTPVSGAYDGRYQHSVGVVPAREEIEYDAGK